MKTTFATKAELAKRWGVTRQAASKLFRHEGAPKFTAAGRIAVDVADAWREVRLAARQEGSLWRAELDRLKCLLLEHELAERQAGLVDRAEVEEVARADAIAIRTALLAMAETLAPNLVGQSSPEAVRAILDRWSRCTLEAWHNSIR